MRRPATHPPVLRFSSGPPMPDVNAYVVETPDGAVVVDATLTVSGGRALRGLVESTGRPLLAVLVTHPHPDHYGGLAELIAGDRVPVIATTGVDAVIRRDDAVKERILRPMFGDEWAATRTFPTRTVTGGETLDIGGVDFTVIDLGPGESPHDSLWLLGDDRRTVFAGDLVYDHRHAYLADGHHEEWLANLTRMREEIPADATLYPGHGDPGSPALMDWQAGYVTTVVDAVRAAEWTDPDRARAAVLERIGLYLPEDGLRFLVELSLVPLAQSLGLIPTSG